MEHGSVIHKMCDIVSPHNFWILSLPFHFWLSFCRYVWLKTTTAAVHPFTVKNKCLLRIGIQGAVCGKKKR